MLLVYGKKEIPEPPYWNSYCCFFNIYIFTTLDNVEERITIILMFSYWIEPSGYELIILKTSAMVEDNGYS